MFVRSIVFVLLFFLYGVRWRLQEYLHAARMYSDQPKSKLKCGAAIFGGVATALYIPYFAVQFSLKKAGLK